MQRFKAIPALTAALLFAVPAISHAANGAGGILKRVEINAPGSTAHNAFHGSITVKSKDRKETYFWGGQVCNDKVLPDHLEDALLEAFHLRLTSRIVPKFENGQNNKKCLVGFTLRSPNKKGF